MSHRRISRRARLGLACAALAIAACSQDTAAPRPKRIILFSMDTVRADYVSGYGGVEATPHLAEIAAEGTRFERCYAASSYTIPSHMSIFTGLDAAEHGVYRLNARLAPEIPTLAEKLAAAGYRTQAFHEGVFVAPRFGFDRGFAAYTELPRLGLVRESLPEVLDWMRAQGEQPYFLFLHTYAAHFPYGGYDRYRSEHPERGLPAREELRQLPGDEPASRGAGAVSARRMLCSVANQFAENGDDLLDCGGRRLPSSFEESPQFALDRAEMMRSYEDRIRLVDRALGAIRDELVSLGQWDDTLLIVTSDHGEAFYEHAGISGHDYVPFEEVLHVPLVVSYPTWLRKDGVRVVSDLIWHLDLLPTVLAFAGAPVQPDLRGHDLRDRMHGARSLPAEREVFPAVLRAAHLPQRPLRRVVISGSRKWIEGHEAFGFPGNALFDLDGDPKERLDRCGEEADDCRRLEASAREWERGLRPHAPVDQRSGQRLSEAQPGDSKALALPAAEKQKLRALGYVD